MDNLQFYPTPPSLAKRAWAKFKSREFIRVLEPSAGNGDLAKESPSVRGEHGMPIDCIEIDGHRHSTLRGLGFQVVGTDFMQFEGGAIYSHIIMNSPFASGAQHVLKAWHCVWDAEIVAILNAETIRNPCSKEREMLVRLIEEHGEVEFIESAFIAPDTQRKTEVEIALVWLQKKADRHDFVDRIFEGMEEDIMSGAGLAGGYRDGREVMLTESSIEMAVKSFNVAVKAAREAVVADAKARRYEKMLGRTMEQIKGGQSNVYHDTSEKFVQKELYERYTKLKNAAWAGVLTGATVTARLSSTVQRQLEADFHKKILPLEFTYDNIHGFIAGLIGSSSDINLQMALDCFDAIARYHSDNVVFFKGWKSNDRHRTCGMSIKTTRFILPHHKVNSWSKSFDWETERLLADFDRVFAMLDGKQQPAYGMAQASRGNFDDLRSAKRIETSYFDLRFYAGVGTLHFFPKRKDLVDRLNRLVGAHRKWLPQEKSQATDAFWSMVDNAQKYDAEIRKTVFAKRENRYNDPFWKAARGSNDNSHQAALDEIDVAAQAVLEKYGIDVVAMLSAPDNPEQKSIPQLDLLDMAA